MNNQPTCRQLRRFMTGIGAFVACIVVGGASELLRSCVDTLPFSAYRPLSIVNMLAWIMAGILLLLAVWNAAAVIRCEDHILLALADRVRDRLEKREAPNTAADQSTM